MKAFLDNLRYTLRSTFDLYSAFGKRLYINSFVVLLWASVISGLVAAGFTILMGHLLDFPDIAMLGTRNYPVSLLFSTPQFLGFGQSMLILFVGLYGIALFRSQEENEPFGTSLNVIAAKLTPQDRKMAAILFLILLVIQALLFLNPFLPDNRSGGLLGMLSGFANQFTIKGLLYDITEATKSYILPCLFAIFMAIRSMRGKINPDIIREYRVAYFASIILFFSLNTLYSAANTLFQDTVARLMTIPFFPLEGEMLMWLFIILVSLCSIMIAAFFYPAFALSLALPFRYEEEGLEAEGEGEFSNE